MKIKDGLYLCIIPLLSLAFLFFRYFGQGFVLKSYSDVSPAAETSIPEVLLYSLWHKQTSTYGFLHINVPDILKCLTDALSQPQILSEGMASRLCQLRQTWNIFGLDTDMAKCVATFIPHWDISLFFLKSVEIKKCLWFAEKNKEALKRAEFLLILQKHSLKLIVVIFQTNYCLQSVLAYSI